jgi:transposase
VKIPHPSNLFAILSTHFGKVAAVLRGGEVKDIVQLRQEGLAISEISRLLEIDRKTVRKYLADARPRAYPRRTPRPSPIDAFVDYVHLRLSQGVWNAVVLYEELKTRGYTGSYTTVKSYLQPLRQQAKVVAVRRFETPPGRQAQVDWVNLGDIEEASGVHTLYGFVVTLGYSRAMYLEVTTSTALGNFLDLHERAFEFLGGVPEEILYDNDGMIVVPNAWHDGQPTIQPDLLTFATHHGYRVRLCRPYRAQTKGKTERSIGYVRQNFLCGRQAASVEDLNTQALTWLRTVANVRVHGTTHRPVAAAHEQEKPTLRAFSPLPAALRPALPGRQVSQDGFVHLQTNLYSVPWKLCGATVQVRVRAGTVELLHEGRVVARHERCLQRYQTVQDASHHQDMPLGPRSARKKAKLHLVAAAPEVAERDLLTYEEAAA